MLFYTVLLSTFSLKMGIRVYKKEILYIYMHIHICTHTTHTHIFPGGSLVKNLPANAEDTGLSVDLENPLDGGAWRVTVHGAIKSWTRLSTHTYTYMYIIEYHSSQKKDEILPFAAMWMDLEGIMLK